MMRTSDSQSVSCAQSQLMSDSSQPGRNIPDEKSRKSFEPHPTEPLFLDLIIVIASLPDLEISLRSRTSLNYLAPIPRKQTSSCNSHRPDVEPFQATQVILEGFLFLYKSLTSFYSLPVYLISESRLAFRPSMDRRNRIRDYGRSYYEIHLSQFVTNRDIFGGRYSTRKTSAWEYCPLRCTPHQTPIKSRFLKGLLMCRSFSKMFWNGY